MQASLALRVASLVSLLPITVIGQPNRDLAVAEAGRRIALVVGNDGYISTSLRTAGHDAKLISKDLSKSGFRVSEYSNTRLRDLEKAIDQTVGDVRKGDIVVVYYAGLCLGIGTENYLVPIDFTPKDAADAKYSTYSAGRLVDRIEAAGAATTVLFLDASRRNPFGLGEPVKETPVPMSGGANVHIVMAAAPGKESFDLPDSRIGLFAGFLSDALQKPNATIGETFTSIQEKVYAASGGVQAPVLSSGADTRMVLVGEPAAPSGSASAAAPPKPSFEAEWKAWQRVAEATSEGAVKDFLTQYPDGSFVEAASLRLRGSLTGTASLDRSDSAASSIVRPTTTPSAKIEKMAKLTKPELDPNFSFVEADLELLVQADAMEKRLERDGMIEEDPQLDSYLTQVGQSILPSLAPPSKVRWRFRVVRNPTPNAFALPNGSIFVNSGLLAILENESQLAGVIAHEITHVTGRHGFYANRDYRKKSTGISIVQMVASYAPTGSDLTSSIIRSSAQTAAILVPAILQATILGYARELERNADLYAIEKLQETGYDPRELANAFRHLQERTEVQLQTVYYNDHPKLEDRINYIQAALANKAANPAPLYSTQVKHYREATRKVRLANIQWTFQSGQRRTALALARRFAEIEPDSPDAVLALADTYRALGPWTPEPKPSEFSDKAKKEALKAKTKLTPQEEEARVLLTPEGQAAWRENAKNAEELYRKALAMDPARCEIFKNLGSLYEKSGDMAKARASYQSFLDGAPNHPDFARVQRKMDNLRESLSVRK